MARIINDDQGGQSGSSSEGQLTVMQADGQSHISLPEGDFMAKGDILRDGQDLILQSSNGNEVVIEGYFSAMPAPVLTTPHGSMLTPELVQSFVKSEGNVELAANETGNDASAVGIIKEVSGDATITHTDGTSEKVTLGMAVHQGDIVETTAQGAVNIVFLDESSFAVSNNARLAIDEYVFDPATQSGETNVSILRGMFVFTSGLIGRDDPDDVQIETPVGSIGIRGTTIAGHINPDGESQITVVEGAIVIKNASTTVTLAEQYETVKLTGFEAPIQMVGTLDANQMKASYGMVGTVNAGFFNTLNTEPADTDTQDNNPADAATDGTTDAPANAQPADTQTDTPVNATPQDAAPADPAAADPATEGLLETEQPVVASYDVYSDPLASNFDNSVSLKPAEPFSSTATTTSAITGVNTVAAPISASIGATTIVSAAAIATTTPAGTTANTAATTAPVTSTAAPPPLELVVDIKVDDDALSGDVVGRVFTTVSFPDVQMRFLQVPLDGGSPIFELVLEAPGVYKVVLTDAGETAVSAGTVGTAFGNVEVIAALPDGRTNTGTGVANFADYNSTTTTPPTITPAATLNLDAMTAADGSRVIGGTGEGMGFTAAYLGDFDRDGSNNFAVGTNIPTNGKIDISGAATDIAVTGVGAADLRVSNSGDFNGDGKLDFLTGRQYFDGGAGADTGAAVLHSGSSVNSLITNKQGSVAADLFGSSLAMTDFNGDGYSDVFVGAKGWGGAAGAVYAMDGTSTYTWGTDSYALEATGSSFSLLGSSMTALQDFNNDGFGDLAVGGNNFVNIYYGSTSSTMGTPVQLTGIDAGSYAIGVYDLGDVNGGGSSDLLVYGAGGNGTAYIMSGEGFVAGPVSSPAVAKVTITSNMGYLTGAGSAGDFNGDGYDDIFVAIHNGNMIDAFVIYGGQGLTSTIAIDATWMANNQGSYYHMQIDLAGHGNVTPVPIAGTSVGDQNGDGFEDLLISSPNLNNGNGGYYVVNGRGDPFDLAAPDPEIHAVGVNAPAGGAVASTSYDGLVGSNGNETLSNNNAGNIYDHISFQAGAGNDIIQLYGTGNGMARVIDGGSGRDEMHLFTTGAIDLRNVSEMNSVEEIAFQGTATQNLTLGLNDIFSLLQSSSEHFNAGQGDRQTLMITNDGSGAKNLTIDNPGAGATMATAGFTINGTYNDGTSTYDLYTFGGGYQLMIEQGITVTVN